MDDHRLLKILFTTLTFAPAGNFVNVPASFFIIRIRPCKRIDSASVNFPGSDGISKVNGPLLDIYIYYHPKSYTVLALSSGGSRSTV